MKHAPIIVFLALVGTIALLSFLEKETLPQEPQIENNVGIIEATGPRPHYETFIEEDSVHVFYGKEKIGAILFPYNETLDSIVAEDYKKRNK